MTTSHLTWNSPLGELTLVAEAEALAGVYFPGHTPPPARAFGPLDLHAPVLVQAREQLAQYFAGERIGFELPLAPHGTTFQCAVWERMRAIRFGETRTYAQLASALGAHPRAVGGACARNPISIVVPCHRMVTSAGGLAGYAGGVDRKRALLEHERQAVCPG